MEVTKSLRYRVQVSQTSTGKKSWDCTVDGEGWTRSEILELSDGLVEGLTKRYPANGIPFDDPPPRPFETETRYKSRLREYPFDGQ